MRWCDDNNINPKKYGGSRKFKALLQQRGMTIEKTAGGVDSSNQDYLFDYVVQTGDTIIDATSRFKK